MHIEPTIGIVPVVPTFAIFEDTHGCVLDSVSATADEPEPLLYARKAAAHLLSISVRSLDYLIGGKKLATRRIGKKFSYRVGSFDASRGLVILNR